MNALETPDRNPAHVHPACWQRWLDLYPALEKRLGCRMMLAEGYRSDARQGWLYGQGRTADQLRARGVDPGYARSGPVVTNAWSAATSAHGWTVSGTPAAAALDVVPLGPDGRPWTADDQWSLFVALTDEPTDALVRAHGLVHFHAPGKTVWDKPHIQMVEWSDAEHRLVL